MDDASLAESRALWFDSPRSAEIRAGEILPPNPDEVRVKTAFSAVSHGTEMLVYCGEVSEELPLDLPTLSGGYGFPIKFGYAAAGRVMETGENVRGLSAGDAVFALHPHQSVFNAPRQLTVKLPEDLDLDLGVFFANVETALNVVHDSPVKLAETAVVFGQGVVGLLVAKLLKLAGAKVIAVEPVAKRRELSRRFSAADLVLGSDENVVKLVSEATDWLGADAAFEVGGTESALRSAIECVADEGTVVVASWHGKKPVSLDLGGRFHRGRVRIRSSQVGGISPELSARWSRERRTKTVLELLPRLDLRALISHRTPFESAPEAYRKLDRSPDEAVQFVFEYGEENEREEA